MVSKKNKAVMGRPTKYLPEYADRMIKYFSDARKIYEQSNKFKREKEYLEFPTFEGFAAFELKVCAKTLDNWKANHEEFLQAYIICKQIQEHILIQGGLNRAYEGRFAMFLLNAVSTTYREKVEHTVDDNAKNLIKLAYSLPDKTKDE